MWVVVIHGDEPKGSFNNKDIDKSDVNMLM